MIEPNDTYTQPVKQRTRSFVLRHAVESLTTNRVSSPLATIGEFDRLMQYCSKHFHNNVEDDLSELLQFAQEDWNAIQTTRVGRKESYDLKVLYLCGPEPLNDLEELLKIGVARENIWAVESEPNAFRAAVKQLQKASELVKLHKGSLGDFFEVVPEQFDVVYLDACGPFLEGKPKTSIVLRELFLKQRMAPLSVLITNFSATPRDKEDEWSNRLYSWYAPRYFQPIEGDIDGAEAIERIHEGAHYRRHLQSNLEQYYSDFVTRFTIEFVNELLPWWRVRALPSAKQAYFAPEKTLQASVTAAMAISEATEIQDFIKSTGHCQLAPDCYQFLWSVELADRELSPNDAMLQLLCSDTLRDAKLSDGIKAISLIRNYFEGNIDWAKHNWNACSDELKNTLANFRWFDSEGMELDRLFCDSPLPNLLVDLLVGVYGYPYHVNLEKLRRIEYCAQQTIMHTDVFILDQCRYLYDLVPTLPLLGDGLPIYKQIQIRICMNLIWRHLHESCPDLYRGSALAGMDEEGFNVFRWPTREKMPIPS